MRRPLCRALPLALAACAVLGSRCPGPLGGDVDGDGRVDHRDDDLAAACLGLDLDANPACVSADLDGDGDVDATDLELLSAIYHYEELPALLSSEPADGASGVARSAWLLLRFADAPQPQALATFFLLCEGVSQPYAAHAIGGGSVVVNPHAELPSGRDCSLSWAGPAGGQAIEFRVAAAGAAATVVYDRSDHGLTTPLPDDYWLVPDASTATGQRVALEAPAREDDVVGVFNALINETAALDGWSPVGGLVVELSDAPDETSLPMTPTASLDPMASIGLFDLSPGSTSYGARVPFQLHVRNDQRAGHPLTHTLVAFPSQPLAPGGRYGFAVTRRAFATPERPFDPSPFFASALGVPGPGEPPELEAVRAVAADLCAELANATTPPLPPEDVALALRITVRSTAGIPSDLLAMKQQVLDEPPPSYTVTLVEPGFGNLAAVVHGTWNAPDWRTNIFLDRDAAGVPRINRHVSRSFQLAIPAAARAGPVPIVMYQHGNPGDASEVVWNNYVARHGFAMAGFTDALNRSYPTEDSQLVGIFGAILFSSRMPEYWSETYGEQQAFVRFLGQLGTLDVVPVGAPDGMPDLDVAGPLTYLGVSEGANHGQAFLAYAPEVRAGVLATGGTRLAETLFHQDAERGTELVDFVALQIPNVEPPDVWAGLTLFQMIFDRQDAQNHAAHLYRDRLAVGGTTRKPSTLVIEGIGDNHVPNNATRSFAWTAGSIPHLAPIHQAVPFLDPVADSVRANVDAETTAAYVQYVPLGVPGLPPSPGCEFEIEGHFCGQGASIPQQIAFLLSAVRDPVPVIVSSTLDGDADGLLDVGEIAAGTDPSDPDSDDDGLSDGDEVANGLDPLDPLDAAQDLDGDGLTNAEEIALGTGVGDSDSDNDTLSDFVEVGLGTHPLLADTDGGGRRDGDEVNRDGTNPLDPGDDLPIAALPIELRDGDDFPWRVAGSGIASLLSNPFNTGFYLYVDGSLITASPEVLLEEDGRELVLTAPPRANGLVVTRKIFVPSDDGFARFLDILENRSEVAMAPSVEWRTNLGSNFATALLGTSSGERAVDAGDDWLLTDDDAGSGHPAVAQVFSGAGAALEPVLVELRDTPFLTSAADALTVRFAPVIPPGGRVALLALASQSTARADALRSALRLAVLPAATLAGVAPDERAAIANWSAPADADGDGLSDAEEAVRGTDPGLADSDGDGLRDGFEVGAGFDPLAAGEAALDPDGDGLDNLDEQDAGTDPVRADSDGDGLSDGDERFVHATEPRYPDGDLDGLRDPGELALGTSPSTGDSDGGGRGDGFEAEIDATDALAAGDDFGLVVTPTFVIGGDATSWRVGANGGIIGQTGQPFSTGLSARLDGQVLTGGQADYRAADGRTFLFGPGASWDVTLWRRLLVASDAPVLSYFEWIRNETAAPRTIVWDLTSFLTGAVVVATSSGDAVLGPDDDWVVTDDAIDGGGTPALARVFAGPGGAERPEIVTALAGQIRLSFALPAFGNAGVLHFAAMTPTRAEAVAFAETLVGLDPDLTVELSQPQRESVVNFAP